MFQDMAPNTSALRVILRRTGCRRGALPCSFLPETDRETSLEIMSSLPGRKKSLITGLCKPTLGWIRENKAPPITLLRHTTPHPQHPVTSVRVTVSWLRSLTYLQCRISLKDAAAFCPGHLVVCPFPFAGPQN